MHRLHNVYSLDPLDREHPHAQGLVGMWKVMPWSGGTRWYDLSGNGNHGTLTGYTAGQQPWNAGRDGLGAMSFDGVDDYVATTMVGTDIATNQVTVSLWARGDTRSAIRGIFGGQDPTPIFDRLYLRLETDNDIRFAVGDSFNCLTTTKPYNPVVWQHIVGVQNNSSVKLYYNGTQLISVTESVGAYTSELLSIGKFTGQVAAIDEFGGLLDDVRIYNRALSAAEIADQYEDSLAGK